MLRALTVLWLSCALCCSANAGDFKRASGKGQQVTLVTASGETIRIREKKPVRDVTLSPDGKVAAWLLADIYLDDWEELHSSTLVVYRDGKRRAQECGMIIHDFWFWRDGKQIAYTCGARRFYAIDTLFDVRTLAVNDQFNPSEVADEHLPDWSKRSWGRDEE